MTTRGSCAGWGGATRLAFAAAVVWVALSGTSAGAAESVFPAGGAVIAIGEMGLDDTARVEGASNYRSGPGDRLSVGLGVFSSAQIGFSNNDFSAVAESNTLGSATAISMIEAVVRDPTRQRSEGKMTFTFAGIALPARPVAYGQWEVQVGRVRQYPMFDEGSPILPRDEWVSPGILTAYDGFSPPFSAAGYATRGRLPVFGEPPDTGDEHRTMRTLEGVLTDERGRWGSGYGAMSRTVDIVWPVNQPIYVQIYAHSFAGALTIVDPVLAVHPDNPELQLEVFAPTDPDPQLPLAGRDPEALRAAGYDVDRLVKMGFLAPVPEPGAGLTVLCGATLCLRRRRR
jgi:hypothetical protein